MTFGFDEQVDATSTRRRWLVIGLLIAAIMIWHGATPLTPGWMHAAHILLRKLFVVPILLAAIWFGMRGAVLAATGVSVVYLPYMLVAWSGRVAENMNQGGEVVTFWIVGLLAGWLATRERRALQHAADMSRDALKALVAALDAREHQTEQHSHRVAELAGRIGRRLRLDSRSLTVLREAAVLHDVGKIGVPDHVLLKPGPLTDEERRIMQRHAEMGYEILSAATHLREVAELVYAHHERFDGTGYPRGLAGQAIPLGARIFAIADVYDALTSDRPYRNAMAHDEAMRLIDEQDGRAFDPDVIAAFTAEIQQPRDTSADVEAQGALVA